MYYVLFKNLHFTLLREAARLHAVLGVAEYAMYLVPNLQLNYARYASIPNVTGSDPGIVQNTHAKHIYDVNQLGSRIRVFICS